MSVPATLERDSERGLGAAAKYVRSSLFLDTRDISDHTVVRRGGISCFAHGLIWSEAWCQPFLFLKYIAFRVTFNPEKTAISNNPRCSWDLEATLTETILQVESHDGTPRECLEHCSLQHCYQQLLAVSNSSQAILLSVKAQIHFGGLNVWQVRTCQLR